MSHPDLHDAREHWKCLTESPALWRLHAEKLQAAADMLYKNRPRPAGEHDPNVAVYDFMVGPACWMLMAMAIENLLKAILLADQKCRIGEDGKFPEALRTHNLAELYRSTGIHFLSNYQCVLEKLEYFIVKEGRYPVPTKPGNMSKEILSHVDLRLYEPQMLPLWKHLHDEVLKREQDKTA